MRHSICRSCERKRNLARYHTKSSTKASHRRAAHKFALKQYGLTPEDYRSLLAEQGGVCAICGGPPAMGHAVLSVDHCHTTGVVRGLLCTRCNTALGMFREAKDSLRRAIDYLTTPPAGGRYGKRRAS